MISQRGDKAADPPLNDSLRLCKRVVTFDFDISLRNAVNSAAELDQFAFGYHPLDRLRIDPMAHDFPGPQDGGRSEEIQDVLSLAMHRHALYRIHL